MEDAREDDRAAVTLKVGYTRLNTFFADYTRNISKGGTFIRTLQPLALGTEFLFELSVPSGPEEGADPIKIELTGVVKWIVSEAEATGEKPAGMGIQFIFADDDDKNRVSNFVTELMKQSLGEHLAQKLLQQG